ncbi:hypothetical protein ACH47V_16025 [Micromonospora chersina]|uniref:hypothetical protein n=1 Tax=Micromonospora chersina TaxID=47854 RepID=UPI0033E66403
MTGMVLGRQPAGRAATSPCGVEEGTPAAPAAVAGLRLGASGGALRLQDGRGSAGGFTVRGWLR